MAVKLGTEVKDSITGLEGVAIGRSEYLYGCVNILVQPKGLKDGKPIEPVWIDEQRLDGSSVAPVGGPQPYPAPPTH